jgi:pimeloyl-ACP methyl ester carboxylesterase
MSNEKIVQANGVDLCVETFGEPKDPALLLIMGATGSMDYWEDDFCQRLAAGPRFVIRYDSRDTGRSVRYEPGAPQYTFSDLVADAAGLLDTLAVARGHVIGVSMGGGIAQALALRHGDRVATLTLISTSLVVSDGLDLPPMSEELRALFDQPASEPDWSERDAVIDYLVEGERPFLGSVRRDDATRREIAARHFDRAANVASSRNHWILGGGEPLRSRLDQVTAPTLVMHGTEDPLFPYGHAVALAREIPGARLVALERVGHEVPPRPVWNVVVPAILEHTKIRA